MTVATLLVVIFASSSKILRRKIFVDDDSQLDLHQPGPGESRLVLPLSAPFNDAACRAAIAAATGVEPPSGRCCIIDGDGNVVGVCNADPALDTHPAGQLVTHDWASPGDRYRHGVFIRKNAILDNCSGKISSLSSLPLDNSSVVEANSIASPGRCGNGDGERPKVIASAPL